MKRIRITVLTCIAAVLLCGCSSNTSENEFSSDTGIHIEYDGMPEATSSGSDVSSDFSSAYAKSIDELIIGTWKDNVYTYTFEDGGRLEVNSYHGLEYGSWKINELNELVINNGSNTFSVEIKEITDEVLRLSTGTFTRVE